MVAPNWPCDRQDARSGHSWSMEDAIGLLLDDIEQLSTGTRVEPAPDPLPIVTGLDPFDAVCGGGLHSGEVTIVEAALEAQARALICTILRRIEHRTLLDAPSVLDATASIVAGEAGVPGVLIRQGSLTATDWDAIAQSVSALAERPVRIASAESLCSLARQVSGRDVDVLIVYWMERFGEPIQVVPWLARLAHAEGIAVLATSPGVGALPAWALKRTKRIAMVSHGLGGRATLTRADGAEGFDAENLEVDCLSAVVR